MMKKAISEKDLERLAARMNAETKKLKRLLSEIASLRQQVQQAESAAA